MPIVTQRIGLTHEYGQHRIVPQVVMVVEVFITECQTVDPLGEELFDGMLDPVGITVIGVAGGKLPDDARETFGLTQQQAPRIGSHLATVKTGHHISATEGVKRKRFWITLCTHGAAPP